MNKQRRMRSSHLEGGKIMVPFAIMSVITLGVLAVFLVFFISPIINQDGDTAEAAEPTETFTEVSPPTDTPAPTNTPVPTETFTEVSPPTDTPAPTNTPVPTETFTEVPSLTDTPTASVTPVPTVVDTTSFVLDFGTGSISGPGTDSGDEEAKSHKTAMGHWIDDVFESLPDGIRPGEVLDYLSSCPENPATYEIYEVAAEGNPKICIVDPVMCTPSESGIIHDMNTTCDGAILFVTKQAGEDSGWWTEGPYGDPQYGYSGYEYYESPTGYFRGVVIGADRKARNFTRSEFVERFRCYWPVGYPGTNMQAMAEGIVGAWWIPARMSSYLANNSEYFGIVNLLTEGDNYNTCFNY
jgi:hypothetical protein